MELPGGGARFERVRVVFTEVCDLRGAERQAALARACGSDAALCAEVEALLQYDGPETDLLADDAVDSGLAFGLTGTQAACIRGPWTDESVGDGGIAARLPEEIGGYRILRKIGDGGMGTVYEAEQKNPQRLVALKMLQRWSVSSQLLRRFRHETQLLGRLQHPGIAQIYEASVHDPGDGSAPVPFFVMELVHGRSLTAYLRAKKLATNERLSIFVRICSAVAYAHQRGVIHRDLKPDNILVEDSGQPKIIDFGIATTTNFDVQVTTLHTSAGQLIGTVPYMSPEQVSGDSSRVDARSDVYALGVVLFEMLTDQLPYDVRNRSLADAVRIIREDSHTRLSAISRGFRGDLETILAKALEKEADRRYQSVTELSADVQRFLDNEPIAARPPSTFYQLSKFARRNKTLVAGVVGVLIVLALGIASTTAFWLDARANYRKQRWATYRATIDAASSSLDRYDVPSARRHLDEAPPELRGWEWHFLERNLQQWTVAIDCGAEVIGNVSFLPGDDRVVAALADDRVCVWDIASGKMTRAIPVADGIEVVGDQAAGTLVAMATKTGDVVVLNAETGTEVDRWVGLGETPTSLAISPNGLMVVVGTHERRVLAWNLRERRIAWENVVTGAPYSPNGFLGMTIDPDSLLVAASETLNLNRFRVRTWDLATGEAHGTYRSEDLFDSLAIRAGGHELAIGSSVRDVVILDADTMTEKVRPTGHSRRVRRVVYSPDGRLVASASDDGTIRVRSAAEVDTHTLLHEEAPLDGSNGLCFSSDSSRLASHGRTRIYIWNASEEPSAILRGHTSFVYSCVFSPDGSMLASGTFADRTLRLWDPFSDAAIATLPAMLNGAVLRFATDGSSVESLWRFRQSWDVATGAMRELRDEPRPGVRDPSGRVEARFRRIRPDKSADATLVTLHAVTGGAADPATLASLVHDTKVGSVAFSPDGTLLAVGCDDGAIAVWNVASRSRLATLRGHVDVVYTVAFSPDGTRLASGGNDGSMRLWDTATWDLLIERHEHGSYIYALAFSPDGSQIATASGDMTLRVWDTRSKSERLAQVRAATAMRDTMRPRVLGMLTTEKPDAVAARLRADASLDDDQRRAALRVLLESLGG